MILGKHQQQLCHCLGHQDRRCSGTNNPTSGGLVGDIMLEASATAMPLARSIGGNTSNVGGLMGNNATGGSLSNSYATGSVTSQR